jgi:5-formyltetrahydrofolate cyclo-ligase
MTKKELRKEYLQKRINLSNEEFEIRNQKIISNFINYSSLEGIDAIHIFLPIEKQREINVWPLISFLQREHPNIHLVISKSNFETMEMTNFILNAQTLLEENKFGILEPEAGNIFMEDSIDMIILPLIAFDKEGHRVGYGKGFYDKFLKKCRPEALKIGLSLEPPVDLIPDTHENDFRLDFCVTPQNVYDFTL